MMAKTTVNGDHPEPVVEWAKNHANGSGFLFNTIKWVRFNHFSRIFELSGSFQNFTKFLIDRKGEVVDRYAPSTAAGSLEDKIVELLNERQA